MNGAASPPIMNKNIFHEGMIDLYFKQNYLRSLTEQMELPFPDNRMINIVIHGHSQTCGYTTGHVVDPFAAYPHQLHKLLHHRFPFAPLNIIVTGIGGECSVSGAERLEQDVLCHKPNLVTIDYALNDRFVDIGAAQTAWEQMVAQLCEKGIPAILLTPTIDIPAAYDPSALQILQQYDEMIHKVGDKYHVAVAEIFQVWVNYLKQGGRIEDLLCGVNHSSELGHQLTAMELNAWFPYPTYKS